MVEYSIRARGKLSGDVPRPAATASIGEAGSLCQKWNKRRFGLLGRVRWYRRRSNYVKILVPLESSQRELSDGIFSVKEFPVGRKVIQDRAKGRRC